MSSFSISPLAAPFPPRTGQDYPTFTQYQQDGVNLGEATVDTVDFHWPLEATRGVGADANTITVTMPAWEFDIDAWLTPEQIADSRAPDGPTIDLTDVFTNVHDELLAKYISAPNPLKKQAGMALYLRVHGSYLVRKLAGSEGGWHPSVFLEGDNYRETIFVQNTNSDAGPPDDHFIRGLARNGKTQGSRNNYPLFRNFSIQMKPSYFNPVDGTGLCGMYFETARNDPNYNSAYKGYNGPILEYIDITGASGHGLYVAESRHAPKIRFCYFSGNGTYSYDSDGTWGDGMFIGSNADAEILQCGSGGNGGHSLHVNNCETPQVRGGDYWASRNASQTAGEYRAIFFENMDYGVVDGPDINGVFEYNGNGKTKSSQIRLIGINFRFRESSFGDGDPNTPGNQPSAQKGYIVIKDGYNVETTGCSYTPWYNSDGYVQARPDHIYHLQGHTLLHVNDRFPSVQSNDWPGGADVVYIPTEAATITNDWSKLDLRAPTSDDVLNLEYNLFKYIRFVPGIDGGIIGRLDGATPSTGTVGEHIFSRVLSASAVALTDNVITTLESITLTPGEWDVSASVQFVGAAATGTSMKASVTTTSGIVSNDTAFYAGDARPFTAITDDLWCAAIGPSRVSIATSDGNQTYKLNVRARFSAGALSVFGRLRARRMG